MGHALIGLDHFDRGTGHHGPSSVSDQAGDLCDGNLLCFQRGRKKGKSPQECYEVTTSSGHVISLIGFHLPGERRTKFWEENAEGAMLRMPPFVALVRTQKSGAKKARVYVLYVFLSEKRCQRHFVKRFKLCIEKREKMNRSGYKLLKTGGILRALKHFALSLGPSGRRCPLRIAK
jgi:hypothetical protein